MHLRVDDGTISLDDASNFRELDIRLATGQDRASALRLLADGGAVPDGPEHAWLPLTMLRERGPADDPEWAAGFEAMIAYADQAGWIREDEQHGRSVRAHLA